MDWNTIVIFRDEALDAAHRLLEGLPAMQTTASERGPDVGARLMQVCRVVQVNSGMIHNENVKSLGKKIQDLLEEVSAKQTHIGQPTYDRVRQTVELMVELLEKMTEADPNPSDPRVEFLGGQFRSDAPAGREAPPPPAAPSPAVLPPHPPVESVSAPLNASTPGNVPSPTAVSNGEIPATLDENLVDAYVEEANELLGSLEQQLTELEQRPQDPELINNIFRIAHSMKGNSYTVGMKKTGELAHKMENVFEMVRGGRRPVTPELTDAMLACLDGLRANVGFLFQGRHVERDFSHLAVRLEQPQLSPTSFPPRSRVPPITAGSAVPKPVEPSESERGLEMTTPVSAPPAPPPSSEPAVRVSAAGTRSLRVDVLKLDRVMNLMGEIVINKSRLDQRVQNALKLLERMGWAGTTLEKLTLSETTGAGRVVPSLPDAGGAAFATAGNTAGIHSSSSRYQSRRFLAELRRLLLGEDSEDLTAEALRDDIGRTNEVLGRVIGELQEGLMGLRMVPIQTVFGKFPRVVRDLSRSMGKEVRLEVRGEETELDKNIVEEISDPLLHLVRNAVDHGIDGPEERTRAGKPSAGTLFLNAYHEGDHIIIEVEDDGRGMDPDTLKDAAVRKGLISREQTEHLDRYAALNLIFLPGFSSKEQVTDVSGRGVGMDVVKVNIARLNGTIDIDTEPGEGTCFTLKLPLTMAIINALLIGISNQTYALPLSSVEEAIGISEADVKGVGKREVIHLRDRVLPVVRLESVLGVHRAPKGEANGHRPVIVAGSAESRVGLIVDAIRGKQEIVIKSLGDVLLKVKHLSGGTILGDGRVVPILNIQSIIDAAARGDMAQIATQLSTPERVASPQARTRIMVVDDSAVLRKMYEKLFERMPVSVTLAEDGVEALEKIRNERFDLVVTDIMMPRMDGFELAKRIRSLPDYQQTPILVVSSRKNDADIARGFESGVNEYIFKPLEGNRLLSTVRRYLHL